MSERNVYIEPEKRMLLRTADVYQTEMADDVEEYSEKLLNIVADFRNSGRPEGFNAQSMAGKSKKGEVAIRLFATVDPETEIIREAGFKTRGCLAITGCASAACTMLQGKTLDEALTITRDDIRDAVDGVPGGKANTLYFTVEAIRALVGDYLARQGATLDELNERVGCDEGSVECILCEHCSLRDIRTDMFMDALEADEDED